MADDYIAGQGLIYLLQQKPNLIGAEIGVDRGVTSEALLRNLSITTYYLIDPWEPYDGPTAGTTHATAELAAEHAVEALRRIGPFKDQIRLLRMSSEEAAPHIGDGTLDFVFIDGNHSYDFVKKDLELYYPKLKYDGIFSGHDYSLADVNLAITEFAKQHHNLHINLTHNDAWWCLRKS